MPPSTRPATPGPSSTSKSFKRTMSDSESAHQDPKRPRTISSPESSTKRDSNRDTKRRRRRRRKAPIVSQTTKNETIDSRLDEHSRTPLSVRNEIIRFGSAPSEPDLLADALTATNYPSQAPSSSNSWQGSSQTLDDDTECRGQSMPSTPNDKERAVSTIRLLSEPSTSLEEKVAQLQAELKSKNDLIVAHQALLNQVQQGVTCQVCLDLMYKPYALAPCGHLACHSCLVNWFTAPPPDNRRAPPSTMRRKTCPHCRAVVRERPVEVWGVKGIAQAMGKSGLLPNQLIVPAESPGSSNTSTDPWKDIFPKPSTAGHGGFPWFFPGADVDDVDDADIADIAPRIEDIGMLDMEDGGIYRCLDCMHEIWDGVCSNCGRVYPGHRHEEDEEDRAGWEDQMGAEEVDVVDDPGWMGLEDGEADDDGDDDDWRPFAPWRRDFQRFEGPWGFFGTIHVDEEDDEEDDDMYGQVDDLRVADDEGSEDEGYESSFIDDGDEGGGHVDGPRIYEIGGDDEDVRSNPDSRIVDLDSDEGGDEQEGYSDVPQRGRRVGRHDSIVVSSDEEADEHLYALRQSIQRRRGSRFVESDGPDAYWSDE